MAKPGPKPKPTALKLARGTRRDRVNEREPVAPPGRPEAPGFLDAVAVAEWERIVPQLEAIGVLSTVDGAALALYCQSFSRMVAAEEKILGGNLTSATARGVGVSPYVRIARDAAAFCAKMLVEFGLTPSSRSRVTTRAAAPADRLAAHLATRPK